MQHVYGYLPSIWKTSKIIYVRHRRSNGALRSVILLRKDTNVRWLVEICISQLYADIEYCSKDLPREANGDNVYEIRADNTPSWS